MKEQPINPPEGIEDTRPQFGTLPFDEQKDIILEFMSNACTNADKKNISVLTIYEWYDETLSQMTNESTLNDFMEQIAKMIIAKYPYQEWCI